MSKTTSLLVVLALALGVFIALNPEARERANTAWQDTHSFFVELYAKISPSIQELFTGDEEMASKPQSSRSGASRGSSRDSLDTSVILKSLHELWIDINARIRASAS